MAAAASTDVRAWLREQGHDVKERGAIRRDLQEEYDLAHQPPPGRVIPGELEQEPDIPLGEDPGSVTGAAPPPGDPGARPRGGARAKADSGTGEKPPRKPRGGGRGKARGGLREKIFGSFGGGKPKTRAPRQNLGDFAEDTWNDLAWLAAPIPPLEKILTIQAPFAGAVFDQQVEGTFIDSMLQPVARNAGVFRALNGLAGPPLYVGLICLVGGRVQAHGPDGRPLTYPEGHPAAGQPVMTEDARTKMLFAALKYSLLQMMKIGDENEEEITARTEASVVRNRAVDALVASIFDMTPPPPMGMPLNGAAAPPGSPPWGRQDPGGMTGYTYPEAPQMDATGADPGRMG